MNSRWCGWTIKMTGVLTLLATISVANVGCATKTSNPSLRDQGQRAYIRAEYDLAIDYYTQLIERKPEDPEANIWLGKCYLKTQQYQRARTHFTVAYAQAWIGVEKPYEIAGYLAESIALDNDPEALFALLKDRVDLNGQPRDYIRWGDYAARFNDPDSAETAYRVDCQLLGGTSVEPYVKLAALYEQIGRTDSAVQRLRQAYGIDPTNEEVIRRLSVYESVLGPTLALPPDGAEG